VFPEEGQITKHFTIDPNQMRVQSDIPVMLKKLEMEYFSSLSNVKLNIVGPERIAE